MKRILLLIMLPCISNAIDIRERANVLGPTPQIILGDSCNNSGRMAYIISSDYHNSNGVAICKQTSGYNPQQLNFYIPKQSSRNSNDKVYIGCTVEHGIATGYNIIWWDTGGFTPYSVTNAQESAVVIVRTDGQPVMLSNRNLKRNMIVNYTTYNNVTRTETIEKDRDIPFLKVSRVNWIKYAFEYGGQLQCTW